MRKLFVLLVVFFILSNCSLNQKADYLSTNFELVNLAEGVYACIHKFGGKAICNAGIIDNGEETIIFDTFLSPQVAEELLLIVSHYNLSPIKYVVNSHFHNDHIRGNQVFPSDVKILSTQKTREMIEENEPGQLEYETEFAEERFQYYDSLLSNFTGDTTSREYAQIKLWHPYYEVLAKSHVEVKTRLPDTTFDKGKSLDGSKRRIQLMSKGQGHSESDLVLYLPDDDIIFTGDVVFNECHPYLAHGYPDQWIDYLSYLQSMSISTVVPGHGQIGDAGIIQQMIDYIDSIDDLADRMIHDNIPIEKVDSIEIPGSFDSWWFERFFVPNVKFMHDQRSR